MNLVRSIYKTLGSYAVYAGAFVTSVLTEQFVAKHLAKADTSKNILDPKRYENSTGQDLLVYALVTAPLVSAVMWTANQIADKLASTPEEATRTLSLKEYETIEKKLFNNIPHNDPAATPIKSWSPSTRPWDPADFSPSLNAVIEDIPGGMRPRKIPNPKLNTESPNEGHLAG